MALAYERVVPLPGLPDREDDRPDDCYSQLSSIGYEESCS